MENQIEFMPLMQKTMSYIVLTILGTAKVGAIPKAQKAQSF